MRTILSHPCHVTEAFLFGLSPADVRALDFPAENRIGESACGSWHQDTLLECFLDQVFHGGRTGWYLLPTVDSSPRWFHRLEDVELRYLGPPICSGMRSHIYLSHKTNGHSRHVLQDFVLGRFVAGGCWNCDRSIIDLDGSSGADAHRDAGMRTAPRWCNLF